MSSESLAMSVRGISKTYRITTTQDQPTTLGEAVLRRARRPFRRSAKHVFTALDDVSFDVSQGEAVGIIGRNGAGKSTMLKVLSRITEPTRGRIELHGRVGSLLEVGTGFHQELTGRENIALNGSILGMSRREIKDAFDSIVDFAGVEEFLETPVKRYSSGMYIRLAFAVAAHLNPEILIVDEVLAVGDAAFQEKCLKKMNEVTTGQGRTVLFVSHNMNAIESLCKRCIHLEDGRVTFDGPTHGAVERYLASNRSPAMEGGSPGEYDLSRRDTRGPRDQVVLQRMTITDDKGVTTDQVRMGAGLTIAIDVRQIAFPAQELLVRIRTETDYPVVSVNTRMKAFEVFEPSGGAERVLLHLRDVRLMVGNYWIELCVREGVKGKVVDLVERAGRFEVVAADVYGTGYMGTAGYLDGLVFVDPVWELRPSAESVS
jgi:lipopolysaccharide transport system ATP-binding protein